MVGSNDALSRVGELATVQLSIGVFSISAGRHKGRHTVPMGVLCCLTVAMWWLEFDKNQSFCRWICEHQCIRLEWNSAHEQDQTVKLQPSYVSLPLLEQKAASYQWCFSLHLMQQHSVSTALAASCRESSTSACCVTHWKYSGKGHKGCFLDELIVITTLAVQVSHNEPQNHLRSWI